MGFIEFIGVFLALEVLFYGTSILIRIIGFEQTVRDIARKFDKPHLPTYENKLEMESELLKERISTLEAELDEKEAEQKIKDWRRIYE